MRLKLLVCEVLYRETCSLVAESPHTCEVEFMPKGLHDLGVDKMRPRIQERIDAVEAGKYDAILLGYGLCNNGLVGITSRHTKLVIPKAHDCITLFLGGRAKYREFFESHTGTYYRTTGWIERCDSSGAGDQTVSQKLGLFLQYEELVRKYGEENAQYIVETMGTGTANYDTLAFIRMGLDCEAPFIEQARKEAEEKKWKFEEVGGSLELMRKFVNAVWDADFLVIEPGQSIAASYNDDVMKQG